MSREDTGKIRRIIPGNEEIVCQIKDFAPAFDSKPMRGLAWSDHEHSIWNSNKVERTGETMPSFVASDKVSKEGRAPWPFFCLIFISLPVWRFGRGVATDGISVLVLGRAYFPFSSTSTAAQESVRIVSDATEQSPCLSHPTRFVSHPAPSVLTENIF